MLSEAKRGEGYGPLSAGLFLRCTAIQCAITPARWRSPTPLLLGEGKSPHPKYQTLEVLTFGAVDRHGMIRACSHPADDRNIPLRIECC